LKNQDNVIDDDNYREMDKTGSNSNKEKKFQRWLIYDRYYKIQSEEFLKIP
jgi:hypothetical protein